MPEPGKYFDFAQSPLTIGLMLEGRYFFDRHTAIGVVVESGDDHAVGTLANVLEAAVARSHLKRLAAYDFNVGIQWIHGAYFTAHFLNQLGANKTNI